MTLEREKTWKISTIFNVQNSIVIATQLKGPATQVRKIQNDSQFVYIKFIGIANHFLP